MKGWESSEKVLESGGFESRQRVLVPEPVVEASEAGARTLGVTYWQAVDRFTRGGVRASWSGGGGKLKLLGGATLLTFGPPELVFEAGGVSCRHEIRGGLLALRAGGSVTLAQRPEEEQLELSVTVEEYLPRLGGTGRCPGLDGSALHEGSEPVPRRGQPPLFRPARPESALVKVTVFGATGVVGRALLPLLAEHDVTAVSRSPRDESGARWIVADAATGEGVAEALEGAEVVYYLVHSLGSRDFEEQDRAAAESVAREAAAVGVEQIVYLGGLGADNPDASSHLRSRRETGERLASAGVPVTTLRAAMIVGKGSAAFETILGLVKRLPVMITPSWVSTPTQPLALDDVARYLAGVCGNERTYGEGYDAGGPRGDDLPADDRADRAPARPRAPDCRGAGADAVPLRPLAQPDHARQRVGRAATRGRAAQSDDRARGADPRADPARAHAVRRGRSAGAALSRPGTCAAR